ncbi:MAG TPA: MBOAT family protein [bacterium]|nr:MBOAT family protein [bacterium]
MLFNSWLFALFFIIAFIVFLVLKRTQFWNVWLLAVSFVFYGWWNPLYVPLIVYTIAVNYIVVFKLEFAEKRKKWLVIAIVNNVLVLGFFKYAEFFTDNINVLLHVINSPFIIPAPNFLFPVGLSFFTFIVTGYIIDVYRGTIPAEKNIIRFATFVSFFPYLLAGPIERARNILPQLKTAPKFCKEHISEGLSLFVVGMFKKIALADFLALYVNKVYSDPSQFSGLTLLLATYAFAWQIYFDFSGYTDMARGCARIMGFKLMMNFNNPYLATGLGDFWRRWHISLSGWFKDYLYIPLGGNRHGRFNTYKNMIITMLIAGLWHGAAWNFVIWGAVHALGRSITRELENTWYYSERVPKIVKQLFTFHLVCFGWIFFRAETFGKAATVVKGIFSFSLSDPRIPLVAVLFCVGIWIYQFIFESRYKKVLELPAVRVGLMLLILFYMVFFGTSGYEKFIYFQF